MSLICLALGQWQTIHTLWCFPQSHSESLLLQGGSGTPCLPSLHNCTGESPLQEWWEKVGFSGRLMSIPSAIFHEVGSNLALHFILFFLSLVLHFPLPLVGIDFSQDQVAWFQWNDISFSIIVPLLSQPLTWTALVLLWRLPAAVHSHHFDRCLGKRPKYSPCLVVGPNA